MRPLQKNVIMVAVLSMMTVTFGTFAGTNKTDKGDEEENIQSLYFDLEKAVNTRRFDNAKEAVVKMLPLMKKDLKTEKKTLSTWEKVDTNVNLDKGVFEAQLIRKTEIYTSAKSLIDSSPAAIRVKGKQLVTMLNEYMSLVNR